MMKIDGHADTQMDQRVAHKQINITVRHHLYVPVAVQAAGIIWLPH